MKKIKFLVPVLLVLMLSAVAMPVLAIGPRKAAEVENNPNLTIGPSGVPVLDTPSGVHNLWQDSTGYFGHYVSASNAKGIINNALIVGTDVTLSYLAAHTSELENRWLYFSHSWFTLFLYYSGVPDYEEVADRYPDGIYLLIVYVG
jgi:hypothetical protein